MKPAAWPVLAAFLALLPHSTLAAEGDLAAKLAAVKAERYAPGPGYSEGPCWKNGEVFFCSGAMLRVTKDRQTRKFLDINPGGIIPRADGHLLIVDQKTPGVLDLSPEGKVGVVADQCDGEKLKGLNDLAVDAAGNVYCTDPSRSSREVPVGAIYRVRPDGRVDRIAQNLAFPNGLDVDPASKHLYVVESQTAKVLRFDLPPADRPLGPPIVFYALGGSGGDGCAFDAAGNLWVADFHRPDTKQGRITVLSPDARALGYVKIPAGQVSNICFGGPNHDEIFVTTGDPPGVFHARVGVPGFKGHPGKKMKVVRYLDISPVDEPVKTK